MQDMQTMHHGKIWLKIDDACAKQQMRCSITLYISELTSCCSSGYLLTWWPLYTNPDFNYTIRH